MGGQSFTQQSFPLGLTPRAVSDLVGMMGWGALSAMAWKQGRSPFKKLVDKETVLSPQLHVTENFGLGLTPRFNAQGEVSEKAVPLIAAGELTSLLVSSRTSKEFGLTANGADESEMPRAIDVAPGTLEETDILKQLGTGLPELERPCVGPRDGHDTVCLLLGGKRRDRWPYCRHALG